MPACFQLTRKGDAQPATLASVDEAICQMLGVPVDEKRYTHFWYDIIGFKLATGKSIQQAREEYAKYASAHECQVDEAKAFDANMFRIFDFLEENYTTDGWYSRF